MPPMATMIINAPTTQRTRATVSPHVLIGAASSCSSSRTASSASEGRSGCEAFIAVDILLLRNRIVCAPCSSGVVSAELGGSALTRHASSSQTSAWASADVGRSLASNTRSFFTHATADGGAASSAGCFSAARPRRA